MPVAVDSQGSYDLGPYRLLGVLRHEAGVVTCKAVHRQLGADRMVKVLLPGAIPGSVARRFVRQARLLAPVRHPGLPATFESGRLPSGGAFVAFEPTRGEPADEWLRRAGGLERRPALAAAIIATVADACAQLARQGIVHGAIRSGNLMLLPEGATDRFTMKLVGAEEAALHAFRRGLPPDVRADIHALGWLFVELLTGEVVSTAGASPRATSAPGIAVDMQRLLGRMLARAPEHRYQSMEEIVTAVELMLDRHRSRFPELLSSSHCPVVASRAEPASSDLTPLDAALTGDLAEAWMAATVGWLRGRGAAAREALIHRLTTLRRRPVDGAVIPTILVAEDDDDTRQSLVELLQDHGYRVIAARHGREAQEYLLKGARAQCMLMDLWMPEMDGWTLAAEMREGRVPSVPTIVMTAAEPQWGYPCPTVVRKPFDSRHLLGLVQRISGSDKEPGSNGPGPGT